MADMLVVESTCDVFWILSHNPETPDAEVLVNYWRLLK